MSSTRKTPRLTYYLSDTAATAATKATAATEVVATTEAAAGAVTEAAAVAATEAAEAAEAAGGGGSALADGAIDIARSPRPVLDPGQSYLVFALPQ